MQIRTLAAFFLLSVSPALAFAGKAVIVSGEDESSQFQLEYFGNSLIRMNLSDEAGAYMLLRDGKAYSVFEQDQEVMVIDLASVGTMTSLLGDMSSGQNLLGEDDMVELVSLTDTGLDETVAGISGDVYEITFVDGTGNTSTETLVLSSDARAREMTAAFMSISQSMAAAMQQQPPEGYGQLQEAMSDKGLLRYGTGFRVAYFEPGEPEASRFVLPAEPMSLDLSGMLDGLQQTNGDATGTTRGGIFDGILGNQAERQQSRIEARSEREIEQSEREAEQKIDSTVDKAVDRVFRGLFGN